MSEKFGLILKYEVGSAKRCQGLDCGTQVPSRGWGGGGFSSRVSRVGGKKKRRWDGFRVSVNFGSG